MGENSTKEDQNEQQDAVLDGLLLLKASPGRCDAKKTGERRITRSAGGLLDLSERRKVERQGATRPVRWRDASTWGPAPARAPGPNRIWRLQDSVSCQRADSVTRSSARRCASGSAKSGRTLLEMHRHRTECTWPDIDAPRTGRVALPGLGERPLIARVPQLDPTAAQCRDNSDAKGGFAARNVLVVLAIARPRRDAPNWAHADLHVRL